MARKFRSVKLDSRNARLGLPKQDGRPHFVAVSPGISLGYRVGPGSWSVRFADGAGGKVLKSLHAIADDREAADGEKVLSFWQAADRARKLARGQDAGANALITVREALKIYADDLTVRGQNPANAKGLRRHLPPVLLSKPVGLLTARELRNWRDGLVGKLKPASVNRLGKSLKAGLNLIASTDSRVSNATEWRVGLKSLPEGETGVNNIVLSDEAVRAVIDAAYAIGDQFGLSVEVHAVTGARSSQIAHLNVGDLLVGAKPVLTMPSSLKGRNRRTRTRLPLPIPLALAQRLQKAAAGRAADAPLLLNASGTRWGLGAACGPFAEAAQAAALPAAASLYCLRHTFITRLLLANVPVRLVAAAADTSIKMIETTYAKKIVDHADDLLRNALHDAPADNVVALRVAR